MSTSLFRTTKARDWEITCRGITGFTVGIGGIFTTYWLRSKEAHVEAQFKLVLIGAGIGGGINDSTASPSTFDSNPDFDTSPAYDSVKCNESFCLDDLDNATGTFDQYAAGIANVGAGYVQLAARVKGGFYMQELFRYRGFGWNTGLGLSVVQSKGRWFLDYYHPYGNYVCATPVGSTARQCALLSEKPPALTADQVCGRSLDSNEKICKTVR